MKVSLIASALLASASLCARLTLLDVAGLKPSKVGKALQRVVKQDNMEELLRAMIEPFHCEADARKYLAKVRASHIRSMGLDKRHFSEDELYLSWIVALLPEGALRELGTEQLRKAIFMLSGSLKSYANFPSEFFRNEQFVKAVLVNYTGGSQPVHKFLTALSLDQFSMVVRNVPNFHGGQLDGHALNSLALALGTKTVVQWMSKVTPKFLDSLNRSTSVALSKEVVENLPRGFLNEIKVANHPADAQYYSQEQLTEFTKARAQGMVFSKVPAEMWGHFSLPAILDLAKEGSLTVDHLSHLTAAQWNKLLVHKEYCRLISEDVQLKDVSSLEFNPECFAKIHPKVQAYLLTHHEKLPNDILAHVNAAMVEAWEAKGDTGLNILRNAANPHLLTHIGYHVCNEDQHPLKGIEPRRLAEKLPQEMMDGLTAEHLGLMKLSKPTNLNALRKDAQWLCYRGDIFELINDLTLRDNGDRTAKQEPGFAWSKLTATDMKALTSPKYSCLASHMTLEAFAELQPATAAAISPNAVAHLPILKQMTFQQYGRLSTDAFALIGPSHNRHFNLKSVHPSQIPHISELLQSSLFSALTAKDLRSLGSKRLKLLTAAQWNAMQPEVFSSIMNSGMLDPIPPYAVARSERERWLTKDQEGTLIFFSVFLFILLWECFIAIII